MWRACVRLLHFLIDPFTHHEAIMADIATLQAKLTEFDAALTAALAREDAATTALQNALNQLKASPADIPDTIISGIQADIDKLNAAAQSAPAVPTVPTVPPAQPGETVVPPAP
jgi:hypothetical protein